MFLVHDHLVTIFSLVSVIRDPCVPRYSLKSHFNFMTVLKRSKTP